MLVPGLLREVQLASHVRKRSVVLVRFIGTTKMVGLMTPVQSAFAVSVPMRELTAKRCKLRRLVRQCVHASRAAGAPRQRAARVRRRRRTWPGRPRSSRTRR